MCVHDCFVCEWIKPRGNNSVLLHISMIVHNNTYVHYIKKIANNLMWQGNYQDQALLFALFVQTTLRKWKKQTNKSRSWFHQVISQFHCLKCDGWSNHGEHQSFKATVYYEWESSSWPSKSTLALHNTDWEEALLSMWQECTSCRSTSARLTVHTTWAYRRDFKWNKKISILLHNACHHTYAHGIVPSCTA